MRNGAEVLREKIDGRGRMSDFKYKVLSMDAPPSRISGYMSIRASTGKEVLCEQLANREGVILYLRARVEASGELQASVNSTRLRTIRFTDFALNLTR